MRELYQAQRERRESIRGSVATPVAALAFSIFDLSTIASHFRPDTNPVGIAIVSLVGISVLCLLASAVLIVRMEYGFIYLDPPDTEEMLRAEGIISEHNEGQDVIGPLYDFLAAAYDVVYRRYFAGNEQAARDRTRGLRLILLALGLLAIALLLLPFQGGGAA